MGMTKKAIEGRRILEVSSESCTIISAIMNEMRELIPEDFPDDEDAPRLDVIGEDMKAYLFKQLDTRFVDLIKSDLDREVVLSFTDAIRSKL